MFIIEAFLALLVIMLAMMAAAGWCFLMVMAYLAFGWPGILLGLLMSWVGWRLAEKPL